MKVKELREKLATLDDDVVVVTGAFDHTYRPLWGASEAEAEVVNGVYHECYDGETMFDGKVVKVFVI